MMNMYTHSRDMELEHTLTHTAHVGIHYFFWIAKSRTHIFDPLEMNVVCYVSIPSSTTEKRTGESA